MDIVVSALEAMEWARGTSQQSLILKIDFDKTYDRDDWSFISKMLTCLGFGSHCVAMVTTLFTDASVFVSINNALSPTILLGRYICQGCLLDPYLYVLITDALAYLLEATHIAR